MANFDKVSAYPLHQKETHRIHDRETGAEALRLLCFLFDVLGLRIARRSQECVAGFLPH